jgi:protein-disulfide isomerase-like protein with CxxC motif
MTTTFETIENAETIIFSSSLLTLAATACDQLENAGIPAALCRDEGRYAVIIPGNYASDADALLYASTTRGEIYGF